MIGRFPHPCHTRPLICPILSPSFLALFPPAPASFQCQAIVHRSTLKRLRHLHDWSTSLLFLFHGEPSVTGAVLLEWSPGLPQGLLTSFPATYLISLPSADIFVVRTYKSTRDLAKQFFPAQKKRNNTKSVRDELIVIVQTTTAAFQYCIRPPLHQILSPTLAASILGAA